MLRSDRHIMRTHDFNAGTPGETGLIERENGGEPMHQPGGNQAGVMRRLS
jgi:hypothetical protein